MTRELHSGTEWEVDVRLTESRKNMRRLGVVEQNEAGHEQSPGCRGKSYRISGVVTLYTEITYLLNVQYCNSNTKYEFEPF